MAILKHVGKVGESPCVILFREVPTEPDNCLVVETKNLADNDHDSLMNVITSAEGQSANEISDVLNRRQFNDGSNMLTSLHNNKKIAKVSVDLVSMTPAPNQSLPLRDVNNEIRKKLNKSNPPTKIETDPSSIVSPSTKTAEAVTSKLGIAEGLLIQAELLERDAASILADAAVKKAQAYELNPELVPKRKAGRPPANKK